MKGEGGASENGCRTSEKGGGTSVKGGDTSVMRRGPSVKGRRTTEKEVGQVKRGMVGEEDR